MLTMKKIEKIDLNGLKEHEVIPGFRGKFIHTDRVTYAHWNIDEGSIIPEHSHPHEQITHVIRGKFKLVIEGENNDLWDDSAIVIPPNIKHSGMALTDCHVVDVFSPVREDYKKFDEPLAKEPFKNKKELTPEQADTLVNTLRSRFESPKNKKLRKMIDFADVEKSLRTNSEKLYVLHKLEETGGEPQLVGIEGDEFIFEDRSAESPSGRRNLDADQAAAQADEFGADMQSPDAYKAMQKTGKFDRNSWSWLKTSNETRKTGRAMCGGRVGVVMQSLWGRWGRSASVHVFEENAEVHFPSGGWRASLRIKKV